MSTAYKVEPHIIDKRRELLWALASQGYNTRQLAYIFGMSRSGAHNLVQEMPTNYESPWRKVR